MRINSSSIFRAPRRHHARQRRSPAERLRTALLDLAGGHAQVLAHIQLAWASITFNGARHAVELLFEGDIALAEGEAFIDALPEHEFSIPGQIVADSVIVSVDHALLPAPRLLVRAELLLLEDI